MRQSDDIEYRTYVAARLDSLRRTAYLLCHDWYLADDVVSISLAKLYRHWGRASGTGNLDAYVHRILVNTWIDESRRPWRREDFTAEVPESLAAEPDIPGRMDVMELLGKLPPRRRAVLVLRYYCDLSVEDAAEVLGCRVGTIKSQAARALDTLRGMLAGVADG